MFSMFDGKGEPGANCPSHDGARQEAGEAGTHRHRGFFPGISRGISVRRYVRGQRLSPPRPYGTRDRSAAAILAIIKRFIADMGVPRAFRSGNGARYTNHSFVEYCSNLGIRRELTVPYTPQQNGPVESTLWRACKTGHAAHLGVSNIYPDICLEEVKGSTDAATTSLWIESLLWASDGFNRSATAAND